MHVSGRTLQRRFRRDTDLSFEQWRRAARLHAGRERIAHGESVSSAARAVGYRSTSAFIAAYRRQHGTTPGATAPRP